MSNLTIYFADNNRNVDVVELLLDHGAELNARTEWGDTALHYAARYGTFDVLNYLCEEGISVGKTRS
jgi:ankyrin repeat protein